MEGKKERNKERKRTVAGVVVEEAHEPGAHLPPLLIAALIAAVSSVDPSPTAPKSLTFLKTWYVLGLLLNAAKPWCVIFSSQKEHAVAEGDTELLIVDEEDDEIMLEGVERLADEVMLDVAEDDIEDLVDDEVDKDEAGEVTALEEDEDDVATELLVELIEDEEELADLIEDDETAELLVELMEDKEELPGVVVDDEATELLLGLIKDEEELADLIEDVVDEIVDEIEAEVVADDLKDDKTELLVVGVFDDRLIDKDDSTLLAPELEETGLDVDTDPDRV
jgi:hypothetical protein